MGAASEALRGVVAAPAMPASFEALFRREYSRVVAIAYRVVRDVVGG